MSKEYEISTEAQVLLKLLRIALGTEPTAEDGKRSELFPENIDWQEVIRLSYEQKVSALAVDGLKASGYDLRKELDAQRVAELRPTITSWIDDVCKVEESYEYYVSVLKILCQIFTSNGLTPIILKGYGLSLNYPKPNHRGVGDIDVYLVDESGRPAAAKGNELLKDVIGLNISKEDDVHHSAFDFKGICVENHYEVMGTSWNREEDCWLKKKLKEIICDNLECEGDLYIPSPTFTYIFLIHHMFTHYYFGLMTVRQFLDYVLFIRNNYEKINWAQTDSMLATAKLSEFAEGINYIAVAHYGLNGNYFHSAPQKNELSEMLYLDMFRIRQIPCKGFKVLQHYYANRWHYKYFRRKNWCMMFIDHCISYIKSRLI